jgi:hypothetical protein
MLTFLLSLLCCIRCRRRRLAYQLAEAQAAQEKNSKAELVFTPSSKLQNQYSQMSQV